jgi:hypothetical protein
MQQRSQYYGTGASFHSKCDVLTEAEKRFGFAPLGFFIDWDYVDGGVFYFAEEAVYYGAF